MNVFKRLRRVTAAHVEQCVSSLEDPEQIVPGLVREMEDHLKRATQAETQALADQKLVEREVAEIKERIERLSKGAAFALARNDEATTLEAIAAQVDAERRLAEKQAALVRAQRLFESARDARQERQAQLAELRQKKRQVVARARLARARGRVEAVAGSDTTAGTLDAFAQMELKVDEAEAEADASADLRGDQKDGVDQRLKALEKDAEVEARLAALRARLGTR